MDKGFEAPFGTKALEHQLDLENFGLMSPPPPPVGKFELGSGAPVGTCKISVSFYENGL